MYCSLNVPEEEWWENIEWQFSKTLGKVISGNVVGFASTLTVDNFSLFRKCVEYSEHGAETLVNNNEEEKSNTILNRVLIISQILVNCRQYQCKEDGCHKLHRIS